MSLSFLAPAALGLAALGALAIIAHLSRQVPRTRQPFGAMLLLQRVIKRLRRHRRLKDPWLLLLRVALVATLAAAAAGPQVTWPGDTPVYAGAEQVVIVFDRSLSMSLHDGGTSLLARGRAEASRRARALPEGTRIGLVAYADRAERLTPALTSDKARVIERLDAIAPTHEGSNLAAGLLEARRMLGGEPGEVWVVTDGAGPGLVASARDEIRHLVEGDSAVIPVEVLADPPRNVAVVDLRYGEGIEGGQVTLRVANYGPAAVEASCEVTLPDGQAIPIFVQVPAGGESEESLTVPPEAAGGVGKAVCADPDLPLDDARAFHLPRVGASRVLVVDGDPGDTPTRSEVYFLERALAPWGGLRGGVRPDVTTPAGLFHLDPDSHRAVFLANVSDPRPFGAGLVEFVRKGGALVVSVGDNTVPDRMNEALGSVLPATLRKAADLADRGEAGIPLQPPDTSHPLFAPFARAGRVGFARVRALRVMTTDPLAESEDVRVLLRWEGGIPALIERRVGAGRVLLWTSTLDLGWANFPLQSAYMPFVQRVVAYLGAETGGGEGRLDAIVGETVTLPLPDLALEPDVIGPDGGPVRRRIEGSRLVFVAAQPGAYTVAVPDAPPLAYVAANTLPSESDVRRADSLAAVERELVPQLFDVTVDLTRGLWVLALALGLVQAAWAARGSRDAAETPAEAM